MAGDVLLDRVGDDFGAFAPDRLAWSIHAIPERINKREKTIIHGLNSGVQETLVENLTEAQAAPHVYSSTF